MNNDFDGIVREEHKDYLEMYGHFLVAERVPYTIPADFMLKTSADGNVNFDDLPYILQVFPQKDGESFSIRVPEEKNGHTVRAVSIKSHPQGADFHNRCDHIKLEYIYIPSTVQYIYFEKDMFGADLLNHCRVEISPDNPWFCVYKNGIYSKDMTELCHIFSPAECPEGHFEVPRGVKRIHSGMCYFLRGLKSLTIPESVEVIEEKAFKLCTDLEKADIRAKEIGESAFAKCKKLVSVKISNCEAIQEHAFGSCESLKTVELSDPLAIIAKQAFLRCAALEEIRLPEKLIKLGTESFSQTKIKKLTVPPSVKIIGGGVLKGNGDPSSVRLEIYSRNGHLPPVGFLENPADYGALITVLSAETNEKLTEFVILGRVYNVFTEHGIDFTEYDRIFEEENHYQGVASFKEGLRAALYRFDNTDKADTEKREFFERYIGDTAWLIAMNAIIQFPNSDSDDDIMNDTYLDLVPDELLLMLIDQAAETGKNEVTARLLEYNHNRKKNGRLSIDDI